MPRKSDANLLLIGRFFFRARASMLSVLAHLAICAALFIAAHHLPKIAPFRLPGTQKGATLLTYYSPGSLRSSASHAVLHDRRAKTAKPETKRVPDAPQPDTEQKPHADAGSGSSTESGIGEGDIRIALLQTFPYPKPDLSVMAHGSKGDVVLDAVIDEHGRVAGLTLLKGLAPSIDETVIATVKGWLFTPATKDGVPVASEQEFHFHYERG